MEATLKCQMKVGVQGLRPHGADLHRGCFSFLWKADSVRRQGGVREASRRWSLVSCLEWTFPTATARRDGSTEPGDTRAAPESHPQTSMQSLAGTRCRARQSGLKDGAQQGMPRPALPPRTIPGLPPSLPGSALGQILQPAPRASRTSCGCHCPLQSPEQHAACHHAAGTSLQHPLLPASPHLGFPYQVPAQKRIHPKKRIYLQWEHWKRRWGQARALTPPSHASSQLGTPQPSCGSSRSCRGTAKSLSVERLSHTNPSTHSLSQETFHPTARPENAAKRALRIRERSRGLTLPSVT